MYTFDHELFLALNFDGGDAMDQVMKILTSPLGWTPLFVWFIYRLWQQGKWRKVLTFAGVLAVACLLSDMIAGIGKHNGLIGSWFHPFEPRLRPMWEPALEGEVHFVREGGQYGTVSGHAANFLSIAIISAWAIRERWATILAAVMVVVVCYTRIYLGYHYPVDLVLGLIVGSVASLSAISLYKLLLRHIPKMRQA